jgi:hypothetical protein
MNEFNCLIFIFDSTHQALTAEKALKGAGLPHAVINTPREFSSNCGISLRIEPASRDRAQAALARKNASYARVEPYYSRWMEEEQREESQKRGDDAS